MQRTNALRNISPKKWSETYAYGHQVLRTITVLILEILNIQLVQMYVTSGSNENVVTMRLELPDL